jgi:triacylglycerol lipase
MLAQLLRRLLFVQIAVGAGAGYLLVTYGGWPQWSVVVVALALPLGNVWVISVISALMSRDPTDGGLRWWRSMLGETWAVVKVFLLRQPWVRGPPNVLPAQAGTAKVPVVLVHGYLCNHRVWDDMAKALRADGHAVFAVDLEPLFTSIDNYASIIEAAVSQLCQHTGAAKVALVGHSKGGLAIRAWLRAHGNQRAAGVITLGTPHAGTYIASRANTPNGVQMRWQSPWLQELAASEIDAVRALFQIGITVHDNIVYPQRAQVLAGVIPRIFNGIGHVEMCLDPHVIHWVCDALSTPTATQGD